MSQTELLHDNLWRRVTELERRLDTLTILPRGCVCPPTSEKTCKGIDCPRRPVSAAMS